MLKEQLNKHLNKSKNQTPKIINKNILSLSHIDLDGIGCQLILNKAFKHMDRMNINYNKIEEYLDIIDEYCYNNLPDYVFITDLSFEENQFFKLISIIKKHPNIMFIFIDHHPIKGEIDISKNPTNMIFIVTDKSSASLLTYLFLKNNFNTTSLTPRVEKIARDINAYDIWKEESEHFENGMKYNDLFWEYGIEGFYHKFKDEMGFKDRDHKVHKELMIEKEKTFNKIEESNRIFKLKKDVLAIFLDDFRSHVTLRYPGFKAYIISSSYGGCSVRLKEEIPNLKDNIVKELLKIDNIINAGGHEKAFGCYIKDKTPHNQIEVVKKILFLLDKEINHQTTNATNASEVKE